LKVLTKCHKNVFHNVSIQVEKYFYENLICLRFVVIKLVSLLDITEWLFAQWKSCWCSSGSKGFKRYNQSHAFVNSPKSLSLAFGFYMLVLYFAIQSKQCMLFQFDPFPPTLTTTWKSIPLPQNSIVTRLIAQLLFYD